MVLTHNILYLCLRLKFDTWSISVFYYGYHDDAVADCSPQNTDYYYDNKYPQ